ncbi:MAG: glycosyltransferase family 2 protein [Mariprofundales bacterium]
MIAATPPRPRQRIGEMLIERELINEAQLMQLLMLQRRWHSRLGDVILAKGWVRPLDFYATLADHFERPFINLVNDAPDSGLFNPEDITLYSRHLFIPWQRRSDGVLIIACADYTPEIVEHWRKCFDGPIDFVITTARDINSSIRHLAESYLSDQAVNRMSRLRPGLSAKQVFTVRQLFFLYAVFSIIMLLMVIWPLHTLIAINLMITLALMGIFGLRMVLTWIGSDEKTDQKISDDDVFSLVDTKNFPVFTILVPMYREPDTLPILANALRNLDYPLSRLDIKLVLEDDDDETFAKAKSLNLEGIFDIIRVPHSLPKTKPKACNYALHFARGDIITIYDAEDAPEPDQLKKVVIAFRRGQKNTAVIQARLNFFNTDKNWLTRMFTLDYSLWYDFNIPALDALDIPIPLGGTSNHFRVEALREVHAWDPFNVTEDADLGVRLSQLGYRVETINSTTFEEATSHLGNWIRQRSRWVKGYMQTYLVHMRKPIDLYRTVGHRGFWGFQFFVGGTIISVLTAPVLYLMYFFWLFTQSHMLEPLFPPLLLYLSMFNLLLGNGLLIYAFMFGVFKRHQYQLIPYALTLPVYWLMMSWAAYKAIWQLIHNPFYWEKTDHGFTNMTDALRFVDNMPLKRTPKINKGSDDV